MPRRSGCRCCLHTPVLHGPTVLGDLDLDFTSPFLAPGIEAAVSVKPNITEVFGGRNVSVRTLQPTNEEIAQALRHGILGVGWRFLAGAGTLVLVLSLAVHHARGHRWPARGHLVAVGTAMGVACSATGLGIWQTYRPDNFESLRTTGLLLELERNKNVLQDVEARGSQATPYILNLLALSQSLRDNLVPRQVSQTVSSRVLLVSDIHGENQYGLMKSIVTDQKIDAVIDLGDLVNFGSVTEADGRALRRDRVARGPLPLRRRQPRLRICEGPGPADAAGESSERRAAAAGRRRLHGLHAQGPADHRLQQPTVLRRRRPRHGAEAASRHRHLQRGHEGPVPDLVVTHEPAAAEGVDKADIAVNGHLHSASLRSKGIAVGTFTGGGVVSHYIPEDSGELRGQPYAFDIAAFGPTCQLASLTRYSYRNLMEGAPVYDNVTVTNGATIEKPANPPETSRSCSSIAASGRELIGATASGG